MFTGLVEDIGRVVAVAPDGERARRLTVRAALLDEALPLGASLAVDGVCLTVVTTKPGEVELVAAAETLALTTIGEITDGTRVNLERPLRVGDRLGGHMVAGHVDGTGTVTEAARRGAALDLTIACGPELMRYVVAKGSVTVDGTSLTVNTTTPASFSISLIPHTQDATTLGQKVAGARVNLEVDLIGKYVERLVLPYLPSGSGAKETSNG